ncbi:MAG: DUF6079 family protein [Methylomonas sp.]|jgi:energy-coupling factor transporter ATP-binding protein EcfA2|uniref:DUF6079 family protein n=1 Tax=Methylomonas sp. TaxID=418 RepID=UPI0025E35540|nr:DUF6079 family protein [Methylomonas sp.]MCK9608995.1 DUF6079 family protein [Methylomonas sp.]
MKDIVQVDTHYTRSINLERDAESSDVLRAYIPTSRAVQTLDKIAQTFNQKSMPRAWSLVGPYGSGKSSFAAFLAHLLENQERTNSVLAEEILQRHTPEVAEKFTACTQDSNAYCIVLLTGSPESLSKRFVQTLYQAAVGYFAEIDTEGMPSIVHDLEQARHQARTTSEIIKLLKKLREAVSQVSGKGILIVIDELGKFLEYEARHQGSNDIFLLQALSELCVEGGDANILLVVLMHQAFEQYSKGLAEAQKQEWSKVQGRFENVPFLESTEQTLRVISAAFHSQLTPEAQKDIQEQVTEIVGLLEKQNALLSGLSSDAAIDVLTKCYPLHPIATLLLPTLCQKVAQNERTLFSYLGSQEYFGFKDSLSRLQNVGDWVLPWEVFEYFIENQPSATTDHVTHRRWAEVITATERLGDTDDSEIQLLKTIGLFNIIGRHAGFKASNEILTWCFPKSVDVEQLLKKLQAKSIINYRKYSSEYRVWEGSDFDLDAAVIETTQQLGRVNLAEALTHRNQLMPVVARRYSMTSGVLRYFQPFYADATTRNDFFESVDQPRIVFFLAEGQGDREMFSEKVKTYPNLLTIYVLCDNAAQINQVVSEAIALEKIQTERAELKSDPVSQRELKDRLQTVKSIELDLLNLYLEQPKPFEWYWKGAQTLLTSKKHLQTLLSRVLETVFSKAPLIKNELINRDKTSGQANAAKNKLVAALLSNPHLDDLGFDPKKYPPEKTIYRAVFKEPGIHVLQNDVWQFVNPSPTNKYRFYDIWQAIDEQLRSSQRPQPLTDIYKLIEQPPYGVQKGVLSLIFIGYLLANQRSLALYESGIFCPHITQEHFEILLKRPELFSVEAFDFSGIRADLFNQYLERLVGKSPENSTLLDIVKPLAKFIHQLPAYSLATRELDPKALAVRDAFQSTQSPMQLLFKELPEACGFKAFSDAQHFNGSNPNDFLNVLVECLNILNKAYQNLLSHFKRQLCQAFELAEQEEISTLRHTLNQRYAGLEKYTVDGQGLKAFIIRLQNEKDTDQSWLESVAAFLGSAPPDKWKPNNITQADYRLREFSERLKELAVVHAEQQKADVGSQATLIRIVSEQGEYSEIAYITEKLKQQADAKIAELQLAKTDKTLKQAILARLMRELSELN